MWVKDFSALSPLASLENRLKAGFRVFNVAVVQSQLGLWAEAACSLGDAISKVPEGARNDLDIALGQVQVRGRRGEPGS